MEHCMITNLKSTIVNGTHPNQEYKSPQHRQLHNQESKGNHLGAALRMEDVYKLKVESRAEKAPVKMKKSKRINYILMDEKLKSEKQSPLQIQGNLVIGPVVGKEVVGRGDSFHEVNFPAGGLARRSDECEEAIKIDMGRMTIDINKDFIRKKCALHEGQWLPFGGENSSRLSVMVGFDNSVKIVNGVIDDGKAALNGMVWSLALLFNLANTALEVRDEVVYFAEVMTGLNPSTMHRLADGVNTANIFSEGLVEVVGAGFHVDVAESSLKRIVLGLGIFIELNGSLFLLLKASGYVCSYVVEELHKLVMVWRGGWKREWGARRIGQKNGGIGGRKKLLFVFCLVMAGGGFDVEGMGVGIHVG
ncbi:hypothetical protein BDK51DRAFT_31288 [Blyttiomyces helicus]|uniref:Uncharacterized protein n=1 Tax=Blyttiomyces helicus TaxID=388810 RepID=A0A4P9WPI7_9FUNG|nr:hypothetical protein BDK51DRAFT_31288 [Blyttiomyces helicus]|eukprot:RKO94043.1 hypothetical protein BDK51DRAFT_31288 [Blyttiomyces helicus]